MFPILICHKHPCAAELQFVKNCCSSTQLSWRRSKAKVLKEQPLNWSCASLAAGAGLDPGLWSLSGTGCFCAPTKNTSGFCGHAALGAVGLPVSPAQPRGFWLTVTSTQAVCSSSSLQLSEGLVGQVWHLGVQLEACSSAGLLWAVLKDTFCWCSPWKLLALGSVGSCGT